jgi:hypothetical protein
MSQITNHHTRLSNDALCVYLRLPKGLRKDIDDALESDARLVIGTPHDVLRTWLEWNGIMNYDESIAAIFKAMK